MKKRMLAVFLTLALCFSLLPTVLAADAGLSNFKTVNAYTSQTFSDVTSGAWYAENVKTAFELDLVNGTSAAAFSPDGNMTVAAALALASRLHSIYNTGKAAFVQGSVWYQVYVDYAVRSGIITQGQFTNYNANATRRQFAAILAHALPEKALEQMNTVDDGMIPDVAAGSTSYSEIYRLYRAGILTGNDKKGTFTPEATIRRSDVAAIVSRMALPSLRQSITLQKDIGEIRVALSRNELSLQVGKAATITATVSPDTAKDKTVIWTSSSSSVASVKDGYITAHAAGGALITATAANGASDICKVSVSAEEVVVKSVSVTPSSLSLEVGKSSYLSASVYPANATGSSLTWESANPNVATVDSRGKVTAVAAGSARIVATAENGRSSSCSVSVKASTAAPTFSVPELNHNYAPMTVTAYHNNGQVQYAARLTSLVFTQATLNNKDEVDLSVTIQGTNTGPDFYVRINLYSSSGTLLDTDYTTGSVSVNQTFALQKTLTVDSSALTKAASIEFVSFSGEKAVSGITEESKPEKDPAIEKEKEAAKGIGGTLQGVFATGTARLAPVQQISEQVFGNSEGEKNLVLDSIDGMKLFQSSVLEVAEVCDSNAIWADIQSRASTLAGDLSGDIVRFPALCVQQPSRIDMLTIQEECARIVKEWNAIIRDATDIAASL